MQIHHHTPLVLASASPVRAQMLKSVGLQFSVVPSTIDEGAIKDETGHADPARLAGELARAKALNVSGDYPDHFTIGADQVCTLDDMIINKPGSMERAHEQLAELAGHTHLQHSAVCVVQGETVLFEHVAVARLSMRALNDSEIHAYLYQDEPLQSCGSYRIEAMGRHLMSKIEGELDIIKGLPLTALLAFLHEQKAIVLEPS